MIPFRALIRARSANDELFYDNGVALMTSHDSPPNADNAASHHADVTPADRSRYNLTEYAVIAALVITAYSVRL